MAFCMMYFVSHTQLEQLTSQVTDSNLKFTLAFGIAIHHAGLREWDQKLVEELFVQTKIQVCNYVTC